MITYTLNTYGLRDKDMQYMHELFVQTPSVEKVILYGSRATGDFERGSDVDLAVVGRNVQLSDISRFNYMLENESPTLLWFDVLHLEKLQDEKLKQNIIKNGADIYQRLH
jgi:predicted nucleotidyltransferase